MADFYKPFFIAKWIFIGHNISILGDFSYVASKKVVMKSSRLTEIVLLTICRGVLLLFSLLPLRFGIALAEGVAWLYFILDRKHRRIARINLGIAFPELSAPEKTRLARKSFQNMAEMLVLVSRFPKLVNARRLERLVRYSGLDEYLRCKAAGRPVLMLTAHLGCWELLSFAHAVFQRPLHFLYRPLDFTGMDDLLMKYRTLSGNKPIPKKEALRKVLRALGQGEDVGILIDQNVQASEGVFVDFFSRKACWTFGIAAMAMRGNAVVIPAFLVPDPARRGGYLIRSYPSIPIQKTEDYEADILENTTRFARAIETAIREYPDRWLWAHRRWKTRPPDDPADIYADV